MKGKVKRKLRVLSLCLSTLLMVIPLLSQPVAAANHYSNSSADTENTTTGPTASVTVPASSMEPWDFGGTITFICYYTFQDNYVEGMGSEHKVDLNVTRTSPTSDTFSTTTGWVNIGNGGQDVTGNLTLMDFYGSIGVWSWIVTVTVWCIDIQSSNGAMSGPSSYSWSI